MIYSHASQSSQRLFVITNSLLTTDKIIIRLHIRKIRFYKCLDGLGKDKNEKKNVLFKILNNVLQTSITLDFRQKSNGILFSIKDQENDKYDLFLSNSSYNTTQSYSPEKSFRFYTTR